MSSNTKALFFRKALLAWNKNENSRAMPWKGEKNPYKIWLSEIILQQTRVEQGTAYYHRFIKKFPTVNELAKAPDQEIFKLWEGLGYYTRCKNLIATARFIAHELQGKFPDTYQGILSLKGIGPYTAAAIASFGYNLPHAVVDGNVMRLLSRYFGIYLPIDSNEGKKLFFQLADELLDKPAAGLYNQAIMDFGATICKPRQPLCLQCMLAKHCTAFTANTVYKFPVKSKKAPKKDRWFYYILAENKDNFLVRKRMEKDIWQNLYEFYLVETTQQFSPEEIIATPEFYELAGTSFELIHISSVRKQQLTHQTIHGFFVHVKVKNELIAEKYQLANKLQLKQLPFPGFITSYFEERNDYFDTDI